MPMEQYRKVAYLQRRSGLALTSSKAGVKVALHLV
jgi:hypothetical protein